MASTRYHSQFPMVGFPTVPHCDGKQVAIHPKLSCVDVFSAHSTGEHPPSVSTPSSKEKLKEAYDSLVT